jgi:hypothetical protein
MLAAFAFARPLAAQLPAPPVVAESPFAWGGYASLVVAKPERPKAIGQDDVREFAAALLAWGQLTPRGSYFAELDVAKRTSDTWTGRETDERLTPVRLYLEYRASDRLRIRAGRFLTPIGQWNEAHAEPLTWTPTRPLTSYRAFSKSITGLLAAGTGSLGDRDWGYALYWAPNLGVDGGVDERQETSALSALGGRVVLELRQGLTLGVSGSRARRSRPVLDDGALPSIHSARLAYAEGTADHDGSGEDDRDDEEHARPILGADLRWDRPALRLLAEGVWVPADESRRSAEGGGFILGSARVYGPLWAVAKGELYRPAGEGGVAIGYLGVTLRHSARLVVKAGYQFSQHPSRRIPSGWFVSFSSLF